VILGATDYRDSGAFAIKEMSWHENANVYAATVID
jgi:hypothetical protein